MSEKEGKIYTITDIAKELGVSKTTVSRALSGKGRIGTETAERVRSFVERHNYTPNVVAKGLAQNKTYNLGIVFPFDYPDIPFFKECMDGICETAYLYNYDIIISVHWKEGVSQIQRLVMNHKVDGMIVTRAVINSQVVRFLKERRMPFVVIGPSDDLEVASIDNPNREAGRELTSLLLMKGLRRLALIGGSDMHYVTESRKQGFIDAHLEQGITAASELIYTEVSDYRKTRRVVEQALSAGADGFICMDETICNPVLGCLREMGIRVPADVKVVSMYDSHQMEFNLPPVTSLRFDTKGLGRKACLEMLRMLGENAEDEEAELSYELVLRDSTKT